LELFYIECGLRGLSEIRRVIRHFNLEGEGLA